MPQWEIGNRGIHTCDLRCDRGQTGGCFWCVTEGSERALLGCPWGPCLWHSPVCVPFPSQQCWLSAQAVLCPVRLYSSGVGRGYKFKGMNWSEGRRLLCSPGSGWFGWWRGFACPGAAPSQSPSPLQLCLAASASPLPEGPWQHPWCPVAGMPSPCLPQGRLSQRHPSPSSPGTKQR